MPNVSNQPTRNINLGAQVACIEIFESIESTNEEYKLLRFRRFLDRSLVSNQPTRNINSRSSESFSVDSVSNQPTRNINFPLSLFPTSHRASIESTNEEYKLDSFHIDLHRNGVSNQPTRNINQKRQQLRSRSSCIESTNEEYKLSSTSIVLEGPVSNQPTRNINYAPYFVSVTTTIVSNQPTRNINLPSSGSLQVVIRIESTNEEYKHDYKALKDSQSDYVSNQPTRNINSSSPEKRRALPSYRINQRGI